MSAPAPRTGPLADVMAESSRLLAAAEDAGVPLRLLGGVAIHMRAGDRAHPALRREPKDIDLVAPARRGGEAGALAERCGYEPDAAFNAVEGARRMLFFDRDNGRQLDVFVGGFEMCHPVPVAERMLLEPATLPLAELLLTKLQIVELNAKDETDLYALLDAHEVGDGDGSLVNAGWLGETCGRDWGLYFTSVRNLERLARGLPALGLGEPSRERIAARLERLRHAIEAAPKTPRWRLRARIGERVRWYELPDEVRSEP